MHSYPRPSKMLNMQIKEQEKVEPIEVKRCFVVSEMGKSLANKSREDYIKGKNEIIRKVLSMTEENLNKEVSSKDPKRLGLYNKLLGIMDEFPSTI